MGGALSATPLFKRNLATDCFLPDCCSLLKNVNRSKTLFWLTIFSFRSSRDGIFQQSTIHPVSRCKLHAPHVHCPLGDFWLWRMMNAKGMITGSRYVDKV